MHTFIDESGRHNNPVLRHNNPVPGLRNCDSFGTGENRKNASLAPVLQFSLHVILTRPEFYTVAVERRRLRDWVAELATGKPAADVPAR